MSTYETVLLEYSHHGRIATVTLNRPEVHNALNAQLLTDIQAIFAELAQHEHLCSVILTGAGKSFSAGADLPMMQAAVLADEKRNRQEAGQMAAIFEALNLCPVPLVARVNGAALGGGLGLLAVCDIVIAVASARLAFSEVKLGIAPAVISPYVLRKTGSSWARRLFVTGERFTAELAREIGLVHTVVAPEELDTAVARIIQELLSGGPQALRACKMLARDVGSLSEQVARTLTAETIARLRVSQEGQEGLRAFLEKRPPAWVRAQEAE
ncbi:MAG TPA: enoyl-CoA hydratase-related protein [Ktedonobacteraceae bacterium]|jgi:methylglutaconyl-CoA hydratase